MKYQEYMEAEGLDRYFAAGKSVNNSTIGFPQIQKPKKMDSMYGIMMDS
ncbi:hypothetical protein OLOG_00207 [Ostreococcus lucimarinus virus OlV4]|nr:hypothetical protein OLOG_00207 [Ostreococcus lucimarinus virus OlV4]